ncbi:MAG TPA: RNA polymerase sigma factor, partial [Pyrinomonadaceae bacterium]
MLFLPKTAATHEDLFVERYDRLFSWSMQLTDRDRSQAEDLLHDAFILFTLNKPDLSSIRNLDAYLHTVLRNLHISQMRSPTRSRFQQLSILDYDSAEVGLWAVDPRDQIYAQDQLRRVCHYACARKGTAKIASVLILRFFHGYYPSEIIQILRTTRNSTDRALLLSRGEAKASLDDPRALGFITRNEIPKVMRPDFVRTTEGFLAELRQIIFRSRQGDCLSKDQLKRLYQSRRPSPLSCEQLSHLVSCASCLDEVNRLLGLPLLSERFPTDTMNKDTSSRRGPKGGGPSGSAPRGSLTRWKREARGAFEHKPKELCIA